MMPKLSGGARGEPRGLVSFQAFRRENRSAELPIYFLEMGGLLLCREWPDFPLFERWWARLSHSRKGVLKPILVIDTAFWMSRSKTMMYRLYF